MTFTDYVETITQQYASEVRRKAEEEERSKMEAFAREWKKAGEEVLAVLNLAGYPEVNIWADFDDMCGYPGKTFEMNMQLGDLGEVRIYVYDRSIFTFEAELLVPDTRTIERVRVGDIEELIARTRITQLWRMKELEMG